MSKVAGNSLRAEMATSVGQVTYAWTILDLALRNQLKRYRGLEWSDPGSVNILECPHGPLIDQIKSEANNRRPLDNISRITIAICDRVGRKRDEGLYGERNRIVHRLIPMKGNHLLTFGLPRMTAPQFQQHCERLSARLLRTSIEIGRLWPGKAADVTMPIHDGVSVSAAPSFYVTS